MRISLNQLFSKLNADYSRYGEQIIMTEDNAGSKLTLSGKSTLTLKNLGSKKPEGSKVVQVEVRKKRVISPTPAAAAPKV